MMVLWAGLIVFLGAHAVPMYVAPRTRFIDTYGEISYKIAISLVSLMGFALIIWGYGLAREQPILVYSPPLWLRHVSLLLMVPVFILLLSTYLNGRIKQTIKHPMFIAIKLWAVAHLLANGTLADIFLFLSFLVWAVLGVISAKRRAQAADAPLAGSARGSLIYDAIAVVAGLALYVIFVIWLHEYLFGVAPVG